MTVSVNPVQIKPNHTHTSLSAVFQKILKDKGIDDAELNRRIRNYTIGFAPMVSTDEDVQDSCNGIKKQMANENMNWRDFTEALHIVQIDEITILA